MGECKWCHCRLYMPRNAIYAHFVLHGECPACGLREERLRAITAWAKTAHLPACE